MPPRLRLSACAAVILLATPLAGQVQPIRGAPALEELRQGTRELLPGLERAAGGGFQGRPSLRAVPGEVLVRLREEELRPAVRLLFPDRKGKKADSLVRELARWAVRREPVRARPGEREVLCVLEAPPDLHPVFSAEEAAGRYRALAVKEAARILGLRIFGRPGGLRPPGDVDALAVRLALEEGLALHLATRVLPPEGARGLVPEGGSGEASEVARAYRELLRFAYREGRGFVSGLLERAARSRLEQAFREPPESRATLLDPETFAKQEAWDLEPAWRVIREGREKGWASSVRRVDAERLRGGLAGSTDPGHLDRVLAGVRRGRSLIMLPRKELRSRMIMAMVIGASDEEAAGKIYEVYLRAMKEREKRFKDAGGGGRLVESVYRDLGERIPGRHVLAERVVESGGRRSRVTALVAVLGPHMVELLYSNQPVSDERLVREMSAVRKALEGGR